MRREQFQTGQVHLPGAHCLDHCRETSRGARHRDPTVRGVLREPELADAVLEHGGKCALEEELPLVDLAQMHQEVRLGAMRLVDQLARPGEQVRVAEQGYGFVRVNHARFVARPLSHPLRRPVARMGSQGGLDKGIDRHAQWSAPCAFRARDCAMVGARIRTAC